MGARRNWAVQTRPLGPYFVEQCFNRICAVFFHPGRISGETHLGRIFNRIFAVFLAVFFYLANAET